ncbi:PH domain-containing protein [Priestia megaterium]
MAIYLLLLVFYQYIDTYINRWVKTAYEEVIHQSMLGLFVLVAVIVVLAYVLSIVLYVIRFGGFTVERYDHYLHIKYGLLNKKSLTIPFHKIQAVTIEEGLVRRLFGWSSVSLNVVTSDLKEKVYLHPFIQQKRFQH